MHCSETPHYSQLIYNYGHLVIEATLFWLKQKLSLLFSNLVTQIEFLCFSVTKIMGFHFSTVL